MNISGKTKIIGIFGYPVEHTLSPKMHNAAFKYLNLDFCYVPFSVKPEMLEIALEGIRALSIAGLNITIPHKERVSAFLDKLSDDAKFIGSVNTIKNEGGELTGFNTDGKGFMKSLAEANIEIADKRVLIVGAGGAARAIGYYLCRDVSELYIYNRNIERAEILTTHLYTFKNNVAVVEEKIFNSGSSFSDFDIIINTTPLGLKSDDPLPLDVSMLKNHQIICDLIYKETPLLQKASAIGCKTLNGMGMLLWQGVFAFEEWTGIQPPVEVMKKALMKQI